MTYQKPLLFKTKRAAEAWLIKNDCEDTLEICEAHLLLDDRDSVIFETRYYISISTSVSDGYTRVSN